jgi:hypothetical protein
MYEKLIYTDIIGLAFHCYHQLTVSFRKSECQIRNNLINTSTLGTVLMLDLSDAATLTVNNKCKYKT